MDKIIEKKFVFPFVNFLTSIEGVPFGDYLFDIYKPTFFLRGAIKDMNRTATYLISLEMAQKLLKEAMPITKPIDDYINSYFSKGVGVESSCDYPIGITPPIVVLENFSSDAWDCDFTTREISTREQVFKKHYKHILGVTHPPKKPIALFKEKIVNKMKRILREFWIIK